MVESYDQLVVTCPSGDCPAVLENENEIQTVLPTYFQPAFDELSDRRDTLLKKLSADIPDALLAVQTANSATAFKPAKGFKLQQRDNGVYSATWRNKDGSIHHEVPLKPATSSAARAFSFAYSAVNTVVGQANMMDISRQLKSIAASLEEAKDRDYILLKARIEAACIGLRNAFCLKEKDHQAQTILERQNDLLEALKALGGFMRIEIEQIPDHEKTSKEKFFSNWFSSDPPQTTDAKKHFLYFVKAFPYWFNGMRWLVLSDTLLWKATSGRSISCFTDAYLSGLHDIVVETNLNDRVAFIPKYGDWDPIQFVHLLNIPEMKKSFDRLPAIASAGAEIMINANRGDIENG